MTTPKIALDEWLAELERVGATNDAEGMTAVEIAEETKCGVQIVRAKIKRGLADGTIVLGFAGRKCISNVIRTVPVYRLAKKGAK